jgi:hypothetical protein
VAARFQLAKAQKIGTLKTCRHQVQSFMLNPPLPPRPSAAAIMLKLGLIPDDWQTAVLETPCPRLLLNCCRQAGKSTVVALLGLIEALSVPGTRVMLLSRSHRQSSELFRICLEFYRRLGSPLEQRRTAQELQLTNLARK